VKYTGVIFDFNGVLFFDSDLHETAWNYMSMKYRGKPFSEHELEENVHGRTNEDIITFILSGYPQEGVSALIDEKEGFYRDLCLGDLDRLKLSPGAIELLEELNTRNIPKTIATASPKQNLDFFVEHLELKNWFNVDDIVYDNGALPGKPQPDIYLAAAKSLGLAPSECIVIEDSNSGIMSAFKAGIGKIYGIGPESQKEKLSNMDAVDKVITQLNEISLLELKDYS